MNQSSSHDPISDECIVRALRQLESLDERVREWDGLRSFIIWIQEQRLSSSQREMVYETLKNRPFFNIGREDGHHIFNRVTSTALLTVLLRDDRERQQLPITEAIMRKWVTLAGEERDVRVHVAPYGWAHHFDQIAQLYVAMIEHPTFHRALVPTMLMNVTVMVSERPPFSHDEMERFSSVIVALIQSEVDERLLIEWVERLSERLSYVRQYGEPSRYFAFRTNWMQLFQPLYFRLRMLRTYDTLQSVIYTEICHRL